MTELSDELLVAYVDGQLAKDQSKAIEQVLENDEVAAERVAALRAAHAHLETAFEALLAGGTAQEAEAEAVPDSGSGEEDKARRGSLGAVLRQTGVVLWVGMGAILIGGAGGYVLYEQIEGPPASATQTAVSEQAAETEQAVEAGATDTHTQPATWQDDLGRAYALLSRETFALSQNSEGNSDLVRFQLSKALDADVTIPDLSEAGFTFNRALLLQHGGEPVAQIIYLPEAGEPIALYVKSEASKEGAIEISESREMSAARWAHEGLSYLLAAHLSGEELRSIAGMVRAQQDTADITNDSPPPLEP